MKVIPAIDIVGGKVVRMVQGRLENIIYYSTTPLETAVNFKNMGASRIHIVDLQGALEGKSIHADLIIEIKKHVQIEVQTGGGLRNREAVEYLLKNGIDYVMIASMAFSEPDEFLYLCEKYPGHVILTLDVKGERVVTGGWLKDEGVKITDVFDKFKGIPLAGVLITDTQRDGTLQGVDVEKVKKFLDSSPFPVILAGGVGSDSDIEILKSLNHPKLDGVVVGRAYYEGKVNLKKHIGT